MSVSTQSGQSSATWSRSSWSSRLRGCSNMSYDVSCGKKNLALSSDHLLITATALVTMPVPVKPFDNASQSLSETPRSPQSSEMTQQLSVALLNSSSTCPTMLLNLAITRAYNFGDRSPPLYHTPTLHANRASAFHLSSSVDIAIPGLISSMLPDSTTGLNGFTKVFAVRVSFAGSYRRRGVVVGRAFWPCSSSTRTWI